MSILGGRLQGRLSLTYLLLALIVLGAAGVYTARQLKEGMAEGVVAVNGEGRLVLANPSARRILGLPPALADRDRLSQILINLIDNAVKFTPEGGWVRLKARLLPGNGRGNRPILEVDVEDTGCGIPTKDLPRLTERFYRVDKARSRGLGGTGLGLSIVKHLVQLHGGELAIDSWQGQGTRVRFTLPAAPSPQGR